MYVTKIYTNVSIAQFFEEKKLSKTTRSQSELIQNLLNDAKEKKSIYRKDACTCREQLVRFIADNISVIGTLQNREELFSSSFSLDRVGVKIINNYGTQKLSAPQRKNLFILINKFFLAGTNYFRSNPSKLNSVQVGENSIAMHGFCLKPEIISAIYYVLRHAKSTLSTVDFQKLTQQEISKRVIKGLLKNIKKDGMSKYTCVQTCLFLWMSLVSSAGIFNTPLFLLNYSGAASYMGYNYNYLQKPKNLHHAILFTQEFKEELSNIDWDSNRVIFPPSILEIAHQYLEYYKLDTPLAVKAFLEKKKVKYGIL